MFGVWQSYKHMKSTEACVAHVKHTLYANTSGECQQVDFVCLGNISQVHT